MRRGLTVGGTGPAIGDCEPGGGNMDTQLPVAQDPRRRSQGEPGMASGRKESNQTRPCSRKPFHMKAPTLPLWPSSTFSNLWFKQSLSAEIAEKPLFVPDVIGFQFE
ncbi:hypothetical protein CB1_000294037 [Camelus ferus]|nr:hypothetical protein CB1_000294037 [Camelus ferus]